jgi:hypothetical protein
MCVILVNKLVRHPERELNFDYRFLHVRIKNRMAKVKENLLARLLRE